MIRKIILFFLLIIVSFQSILAQNRNTTLHVDKDFYVTGETIWYKLYLPHAPSGKEVAIKTSLLLQSGKIIHSYFCNTHGSQFIYGHFDLPYDLTTGWLQLIFSNFDPKTRVENLLAGVHIPVYNDLLTFPTQHNYIGSVTSIKNDHKVSKLTINISPAQIRPREVMRMELFLTDSLYQPIAGNASITVLDENLNKVHETISTTFNCATDKRVDYANVFNFDFISDYNATGNREYIGIYFKESFKFRYLSSLGNKFTLVHDPFTGVKASQEIFVSNFKQAISQSSISLEPITTPVPFNTKIKEYLEWSSMRKKTLSIFPTSASRVIKMPSKAESKDLPSPDRSIEISKYDEFEDIFTFFKELSTPLKFKLDKNRRVFASIYNPELSKVLEGKPIFIVDGNITDRADWVAKLPMISIKKVDIFFNTKSLLNYYGMLGKSGLVIIQTKAKLNLPDSIPHYDDTLYGFISALEKYEVKQDQIAAIKTPIFRPVIYWNANIPIDTLGKANLIFLHTDDIGDFVIKAVVIDGAGNITTAQTKYTVVQRL